jgi:Na+/melibiose symporter-like transporter
MRADVLVWTALGGGAIAFGLYILMWLIGPPKSDKGLTRMIVAFIVIGPVVAYFAASAYYADVPYQEPQYNPDQEACIGGTVGCH